MGMDIITVDIEGVPYKFRYSMRSLARWQRAEGLTLSHLSDPASLDLMHLANLFRFASEEAGQPLSLDTVYELMERKGAIAKLTESAMSQLNMSMGGEEEEGDSEKKSNP